MKRERWNERGAAEPAPSAWPPRLWLAAVAALVLLALVYTRADAASLPVAPCDLRSAAGPSDRTPPNSLSVNVPPDIAAHVQVYWTPYVRMVGPRGLRCTGTEGTDGSALIRALAPGAGPTGLGLTVQSIPACVYCQAALACGYFPNAASAIGEPCSSTPPRRERVIARTRYSVIFLDPPGVRGLGQGSGGSLPALSVLYYRPSVQYPTSMLTCRLPKAQDRTCRASINEYAARGGR